MVGRETASSDLDVRGPQMPSFLLWFGLVFGWRPHSLPLFKVFIFIVFLGIEISLSN